MSIFQIAPLQASTWRGSYDALEEQFANYLATLSGPWRMWSVTRPFTFDRLRAQLNRQAQALDGRSDRPDFWRWRWLKHYRRMYDQMEALERLLAIDHYLLYQPAEPIPPEVLAETIREQFLLPEVRVLTTPPALIPGRYAEERDHLRPLDGPAYPWLRILTGYDSRGEWNLFSWRKILMESDFELALCIDATTLAGDSADRKASDAAAALDEAVNGRYAINDRRSRRALEDANYALDALDRNAIHLIAYAILLRAATKDELDRQTHRLRSALGSRLKLDIVPGGQFAAAPLFTPAATPTLGDALVSPIVRRNSITPNLAVKVPWLNRKTARDRVICFGYDPHEGMPILFDIFGETRDENAHMLVVGQSNSGKTTFLLCMALRHAVAGAQIIFIDPLGKGGLLCDAVGAEASVFYEISATSSLNILDRVADNLGTQRAVIVRRLSIVLGQPDLAAGRVGLRPRQLTNFEIGALDLTLAALYADPEHTPILSDLVRELEALHQRPGLKPYIVEAGARLAAEIESVLLGSRGELFNRPTTLHWDFSAQVTAYSFAGVVTADKALMPLLYDHAWEAIDRFARTRPKGSPLLIVIIDELAYLVASGNDLQVHIAMNTKAGRNLGMYLWTADQDAATYYGADGNPTKWEQYIAGNTAIKAFFRQEGSGARIIGQAYPDQLGVDQMAGMKTAAKGYYIGLWGDEIHHIMFQPSSMERLFFFPKPPVDEQADDAA